MSNWNLKITDIRVTGFTARLTFKYTKDQLSTVGTPYQLIIREQFKDDIVLPTYYWMGNMPSAYENNIEHIELGTYKKFDIRINLQDGEFTDRHYIKKVTLLLVDIYNDFIDWEETIELFTKDVIYPKMLTTLSMVNGILNCAVKLTWDRDNDFNFNSKAFKLRTTLISNTSLEPIAVVTSNIQNEDTVIPFYLENNIGSYTVINDLITFSGVSVLSDTNIYTKVEKPLGIYIVRSLPQNRNIKFPRQLYKGFIKGAENTIKQIVEYKVK
jgi:hypothetical protein